LSLSIGRKTPQICFQALVDNFSLTINIGMIGRAEMQLCSLELEQFLTKVASEGWIVVGGNRVRHSMKFEDINHENLSHDGCCERVLEGTQMSIFRKVIDYNHDD
jgi:hypothetical protein